MKKVFAFFLGLFLALTCFPSGVVAESLDVGKSTNNIMLLAKKVEVLLGNNVSTRIMETAIADITTLDQHNIPQGYLVDISKNERNRLTYTYAFTDQILSKISVQRNENGLFLRLSPILCKPPGRCKIEAPKRRF